MSTRKPQITRMLIFVSERFLNSYESFERRVTAAVSLNYVMCLNSLRCTEKIADIAVRIDENTR